MTMGSKGFGFADLKGGGQALLAAWSCFKCVPVCVCARVRGLQSQRLLPGRWQRLAAFGFTGCLKLWRLATDFGFVISCANAKSHPITSTGRQKGKSKGQSVSARVMSAQVRGRKCTSARVHKCTSMQVQTCGHTQHSLCGTLCPSCMRAFSVAHWFVRPHHLL